MEQEATKQCAYAFGVRTNNGSFVFPTCICKSKEGAIEQAQKLQVVARRVVIQLEDSDLPIEDAPEGAVGILTEHAFTLIGLVESVDQSQHLVEQLRQQVEVHTVDVGPPDECEINCHVHGPCAGLRLEVTDHVVWRNSDQ